MIKTMIFPILDVFSTTASIPINLSMINVTLILCLFTWFLMRAYRYQRQLPPGPWGIPYFGYLPYMKGPPHRFYLEKSKEYGKIFSLKLGNNLVVCIGSAKLMKDLFYRQDSTGRPDTPMNNLLGGVGIVLSQGLLWKKQRQFLHEKFRSLGVKLWPNQRFEKFVHMEMDELLKTMEDSRGKPVNPSIVLGRHMHNVICQLMMSFRFEEGNPDFEMFNDRVTRGMKLYGSIHIGELLYYFNREYIKHYLKLPGKQAVLNEIKVSLKDISKFHGDRLEARKRYREEYGRFDEPADLLDHYLDVVEREQENNDTTVFPDTDYESQIVQVMNDLFSAGMETTRTSILWCFIMMLREPFVAETVREELSKVVTVGQLVTLEHRLLLPYTEAVIFETLRMVSVVPLGTTHVNIKPWKVDDYIIPAGTHIIPLINKMNFDPEVYPEPQKFIPERFIKEGKFHASETFMQFGVGQRMCLGTQLARMELFLFFANIMNSFEFAMPCGEEIPSLDGVLGTTHAPHPFDLCFTKREY